MDSGLWLSRDFVFIFCRIALYSNTLCPAAQFHICMETLATSVGAGSSIGPSHSGFLGLSSGGVGVSAAGSAALRERLERQARQRLEMLDADNQHDDPHTDLGSASRKNIFDDDDGARCLLHSF